MRQDESTSFNAKGRRNKTFSDQYKPISKASFCNYKKRFRTFACVKFEETKPPHPLWTSHQLLSRRTTLPCCNEFKIEGLLLLKEVLLKEDYICKVDLKDVYILVLQIPNVKNL